MSTTADIKEFLILSLSQITDFTVVFYRKINKSNGLHLSLTLSRIFKMIDVCPVCQKFEIQIELIYSINWQCLFVDIKTVVCNSPWFFLRLWLFCFLYFYIKRFQRKLIDINDAFNCSLQFSHT